MHGFRSIVACLAAVVWLAACQERAEQAGETVGEPSLDLAAEEEALNAIVDRYAAAVTARDAAAAVALYAEDAVLLPPDEPLVSGRAAIEQMEMENLAELPQGVTAEIRQTDVDVASSGEMAFAHGEFIMSGTRPDGTAFQDVSKYLVVFRKEGEEWKVVRVAWNRNEPTAGAAGEAGTTPAEEAETTP